MFDETCMQEHPCEVKLQYPTKQKTWVQKANYGQRRRTTTMRVLSQGSSPATIPTGVTAVK